MRDQGNKPRSRYFRFGLRTMFVLVFLVACGFGVDAWLLRDIRQQQAIEAELEALGCSTRWDEFVYSDPEASSVPEWLVDLLGEDPNSKITLVDCELESAEQMAAVLDAVERLPAVERLEFSGPGESYESWPWSPEVQGFRAMPEIQALDFFALTLNDATLNEISGMNDLSEVIFRTCDMSGVSAKSLRKLPAIQTLELRSCSFYGNPFFLSFEADAMAAISEIKSLRQLKIIWSAASDADFATLADLPNLEHLSLYETDITDATIPILARIKNLKSLDVTDTKISPAGIQRLRLALPNTKVID